MTFLHRHIIPPLAVDIKAPQLVSFLIKYFKVEIILQGMIMPKNGRFQFLFRLVL